MEKCKKMVDLAAWALYTRTYDESCPNECWGFWMPQTCTEPVGQQTCTAVRTAERNRNARTSEPSEEGRLISLRTVNVRTRELSSMEDLLRALGARTAGTAR